MTTVVSEQPMTTAATATITRRSRSRRTAAITRAAGAAMATMTSHSHLLTAHEGDADDREENRDAKNKHTIHPKILQVTGSGT
jgi:hypothetical protein